MRLLRKAARLGRLFRFRNSAAGAASLAAPSRRCGIEELEERRFLAADLHLGAVYFEEATGDDSAGDRIEITFEGGQPGSQLTSLAINGDKLLDGGLTLGDIFFDIAAGGAGSFKAVPLSIVSNTGFTITNISVQDGSSLITFQFAGFDAGEKLIFDIDVDEQGLFSSTSVAEGGEFEGSRLTGTFTNPHYETATLTGVFFDEYNDEFAQAAAATGTQLNLPPDNYVPPGTIDREDRTAGGVATFRQIPKPITVSGRVFNDPNLSNSQDASETGISGVTLTLLQWNGTTYTSTGKTTTTNTLGDYKFDGILPGKYRVVETQPSGYLSVGSKPGTVGGTTVGVSTSPDVLSEITLLGGQDSVRNDFAEVVPGSIRGRVYADPEGDCVFGVNDQPLSGVKIELLNTAGAVIQTTFTNSSGQYEFAGLMPGTYGVRETQPAGYYQGGQTIGTGGGVISAPDVTSQIRVAAATGVVDYDFCELLPASLAGRVFTDPENDGQFGSLDTPLSGVVIELLNTQGVVVQTTQTNAQGQYNFTNLQPGTYSVREKQPAAYYDGGEKVGSHGGTLADDFISQITLGSAAVATGYDFWELLPGSISGRVHADPEGDCIIGPLDIPLSGVAVQLLDAQGNVLRTTFTDSEGRYRFDNLKPGVYGIRELQPEGYYDGNEHVGSGGGVIAGDDHIAQIEISSDEDAVDYDFCENIPGSLAGRVYADPEEDCIFGPQDTPLAGVKIELLDEHDIVVATTFTDSDGKYNFDDLAPGKYKLRETQPAGYFQGAAILGSTGGVIVSPDVISEITITSALHAVNYDFCENIPGSIAGRVYADPENDCLFGPQDRPLAGVKIELLNGVGQIVGTTLTDSQGRYRFDNLAPGAYSVREYQPNGYYQGGVVVGSAGGVAGPDIITQIVLHSATNGVNYDFCELIPSSLAGRVFADPEGDCFFGERDVPLAGVKIDLLNAVGVVVQTTFTDATGQYKFDNLAPGAYAVRETQPSGYFQGGQRAGSAGGVATENLISQIVLASNVTAVNYDFCELMPGSISGRVHADPEGDCIVGPSDIPLAGVRIDLLDFNGVVVATTLTDSQGFYQFVGIAPGAYGVREHQPAGFLDGDEHVGTAGGVIAGNDLIGGIAIGSGVNGTNYDFCERPLGSISGYVFQDGPTIFVRRGESVDPNTVRDGVRGPGDVGIAGVTLLLGDASGRPILDALGNPRIAVTEANGFYQFTGLLPDLYTIREIQPGQYIDFLDTAGTTGGFAVNPQGDIDPLFLQQLTVPHNFDAIIRIPLAAGRASVENNFSEVRIQEQVLIPPPEIIPTRELRVFSPAGLLPPVREKLLPEPLAAFIPPEFIGGNSAIGYTWHLSVIDGGLPRSISSGEMLVDASSNLFNVSAWTGGDMDEAQWTLVRDYEQPGTTPVFGAANSIPISGDFNGDGHSEVGVFRDGEWFIDLNANGQWDEGDLWAQLGKEGDKPVVGDWDGDGKDDIGIFGPSWPGDPRAVSREPGLPHSLNRSKLTAKNVPPKVEDASLGKRMVKVTSQGALRADLIDHVFNYGVAGDRPLAGDWAGNGVECIAVYRDGVWHLDLDGDGRFTDVDRRAEFGAKGDLPVAGDWDGDGITNVGVYRHGTWILDTNKNYRIDAEDRQVQLGSAGDKPVVGDWNGSGRDQIGLFHEGRVEHSVRR